METEPDLKESLHSNLYSNSGDRTGLQETKCASKPAGQTVRALIEKNYGSKG